MTKVKWQSALYVRQPYEDNYVPECFLERLVTNIDVSRPDFLSIVVDTTLITQQISIVAIFLVFFMCTSENSLPTGHVLLADMGLFMSGYFIFCVTNPRKFGLVLTLWWFFLFVSFLRVLAPVLRTLTVAYSDDTIYALSLLLLGLHLIAHQYSYTTTTESDQSSASNTTTAFERPSNFFSLDEVVSHGVLSLNASIFATILLASRFESNEMVFAFTLFAIQIFAFYPIVRQQIRRRSLFLHLMLSSLLFVTASASLRTQSTTLFVIYLLAVGFVTLMCPTWLLIIHERKFIISGPWDVAKPEEIID